MALHLGRDNNLFKVCLNGATYHLNFPTFNKIALISSDDYVLKDINKLYLIAETPSDSVKLVTLDNYILKSLDKLYLIPNGGEVI